MTRAVSRGASSYRARLRSFSAPALKGEPPPAPLLARANDKPWAKETWKRPIADAVAAAKLPVGTTAYTLRHSIITDLVDARSPLLSVAQISGTNAEMIERHYGHLSRTETGETLSKLAL